ncbi:hypothetical protein WN51_04615 [Melipona quadrifasciata]|uniref:Uncharacterized protein n=1 Tax=Melipona quadrifasciata TaxID=166423 RepID=A0A0M8ZWZ1_9HYME|nr:hypothetical protein WN51_04615 [Melipona quadrifasciata]
MTRCKISIKKKKEEDTKRTIYRQEDTLQGIRCYLGGSACNRVRSYRIKRDAIKRQLRRSSSSYNPFLLTRGHFGLYERALSIRGLSPRANTMSLESELYCSKVDLILNCKPKESADALWVPLPSASENHRPRVGTKGGCPLPSWVISRARVSHVFGKVGAILQSTVEGLVCLEQSPAMWSRFLATQAC